MGACAGLEAQRTIPHILFMAYQGTFAIITAALISGAIVQATAIAAVLVYSGVASLVLLKLIALFVPLRARAEDETAGLDIALHGEEAYVAADGFTGVPATREVAEAAGTFVLTPGVTANRTV